MAAIHGPYTDYLAISPEIEATEPGWLEHMMTYGQRTDVGVVGPLLLDRRNTVHGGGLIDRVGRTDRTRLSWFSVPALDRGPQSRSERRLLAGREVSAVPLSGLLTRADVFDQLKGFDERLSIAFPDADIASRFPPWDTSRFTTPTRRAAASRKRSGFDPRGGSVRNRIPLLPRASCEVDRGGRPVHPVSRKVSGRDGIDEPGFVPRCRSSALSSRRRRSPRK